MSKVTVSDTIDKLCEVVKALARQADAGSDDAGKTFVDTVCEAFGKDVLKDVLDDFFDTSSYNDEWVKIQGDEDATVGAEERLRMSVAFLSMWKKALMRLPSSMTDVDRVYRAPFSTLNSGYASLVHTKLKLAEKPSVETAAAESGGSNG